MASVNPRNWALRPLRRFDIFFIFGAYYLLWLFSQSVGAFVGSVRADEIHFLQNSWMAYAEQPALEYIPPLYHHLLKFSWWVWGGDMSNVYGLRLFSFALFCTQAVLVYKILSISFVTFKGKYFALVFLILSLLFVTLLAAFRGYEIRPEGLGNTLLLFSFLWLMLNRKIDSWARYSQLLLVCVLLVAAASMSLRFVLPAISLWMAVVVQMHWNNQLERIRGARAFLGAVLVSLAAALAVAYLFVDWDQVRGALGRHSENSVPMSAMTRFTINAWTGYKFISLICLGAIGVVAACAIWKGKAAVSRRVVNALLVLPLLSFYLFLFVWDVNPRGYIHSIEWILMLGLVLFSIGTAVASIRASALALLILASVLYLLSYGAVGELSAYRNSGYFLGKNWKALDARGWVGKSDSSLLKDFDINSGLVDQVESRREFCARHAGSFVVAGIINSHPICLIDRGTYDFSGWGKGDVDLLGLPPDQSLIVLAAEPAKLTPLIDHYGDRYRASPGVSIIQKR